MVENDEMDDVDDWDEEHLPCSWNYVLTCLVLPFLDGNLSAFAWPGFTIYYAEMGWPSVNAGLAVTVGYIMRIICQQMQRHGGFWVAVPLAVTHLAVALVVVFSMIFGKNSPLKL